MIRRPEFNVKFTRKQSQALKSQANEILYGGAAGGGKSYFMRALACILCGMIPGLNVYLFRRIREDLVKNHIEGTGGFPVMLAELKQARKVEIVDDEIRFWNSSKIFLCHCKDEKDRFKYLGAEIHVLLVDEATMFTEVIYRFLRGRLRAPNLAIPQWAVDFFHAKFGVDLVAKIPMALLGSNPGNIGHQWVKAAFIDGAQPFELRRMSKDEGGMLRQYVPAKLEDNPHIDTEDYEGKLSGLGSKELVRAMRHGDWNIVAGAFFDHLSADRHSLPAFTPPAHWTRFRSLDWGSSKPFSVGWWVIAEAEWVRFGDGVERMLPAGALVRYREWYGCQKDQDGRSKPDTGLRLSSEAVGRGILEREIGEKIDESLSPADPSLWKEDGGPSHAERMLKCDPKRPNEMIGPRFKPADNNRTGGWQQVYDRLKWVEMEHGEPMLYVTSSCIDWWRTVPALMHDEHKPEDVDSRMEDHCFAAGTLVSTPHGSLPIDKLPPEGIINTSDGPRNYHGARMTRRNAPVVRLTFEDGSRVVCTPDHRFVAIGDEWRYARDLEGVQVVCSRSSSAENPPPDAPLESMTSSANAQSVARHSGATGTAIGKPVPRIAERSSLLCVAVEPVGSADVYCLTVPTMGSFLLANGAVVSNCGDETRYACMARPVSRIEKKKAPGGPKPWTLDWILAQKDA